MTAMPHNNNKLRHLVFLGAILAGLGPRGADAETVASPSGRVEFELATDSVGAPVYSVRYDGESIVTGARLGLRFEEQPDFDTGFEISAVERSQADETWELPWGERRLVRDRYNGLTANFRSADGTGRRFALQVRAYDDGIGFRYTVPRQAGYESPAIADELTEFRLHASAIAYWQPGSHRDKYEVLYRATPVSDVGNAHTPLTIRMSSGVHVSLHEAALVDFPAYTLERAGPGMLTTALRPRSDGAKARVTTPFATPWRTIQLAPDAHSLVDSTLVLNLNEPNRLGDVSWVRPGKYVGIWWAIHLGQKTWQQGPLHGATTAEAMRHVDFAAEHGFTGVLVEGWNVGWGDGEAYSFIDATADLDLDEVAAYARDRGVRIIGHHETFGDIAAYERVMREAFDRYAALGVEQVKTGYVGPAGSLQCVGDDGLVHDEWHDSQCAVEHQLRVLEEAAGRHISINTHEPVKDTGLRRTYPNWLSREGARGQEFAVWGETPNPPEHTVMLAFTRMLAGPLDFTPGIFGLEFEARGERRRINTTLAKQLALYVVLYSPVQMVPDLIENYARHPDAFQFIVDVPTDWDDTVGLAGEVGDYVAIARKDRNSDDWYLGAITDEHERTLRLSMSFLPGDREYVATIYGDGADADWRTDPFDYRVTRQPLGSDSKLELRLAAGGGAAIRIQPLAGSRQ